MVKNNSIGTGSGFHEVILTGIEKGIISLNEDGTEITYFCTREYTKGFKNPEETIRAYYFTKLVLNYKYLKSRINIEVKVPRRVPSDRADIVVYKDKECKQPYIVVECKKDGITDEEYKQAIEQVFGNANSLRADFAVTVAGNTKTAFDVAGFKPSERETNVIADIPIKYGKAPKYKFIKGDKDNDLRIISRDELIRTLEKCHDTVWQGGKLAPTVAFDEVSKLLFCKLKDEKEGTKKGGFYRFQIGTHESTSEVFSRINSIYEIAKTEDKEVFKDDINLPNEIIYRVVEHLQSLALNKIELDTKGVAFECFMQDFFKGKMGQFFTPRPIVEFCINILEPKQNELIVDPACGSGGFLLYSLNSVRKYAAEYYEDREGWDYWHKFAQNNLYGIEINEQIARVCKMNMIIHDDGHSNIISYDALKDIDEISDLHKGFNEKSFDMILTNPPFGAKIKKAEKSYLNDYELGKEKNSQKSEVLFIERCIDFLKPGTGRIGIILPDSITVNPTLQYVREFLIKKTQILAIFSLPGFAFSHYGANVKASILFLRRLTDDEEVGDYPVFMANIENVGYTAAGKEDLQNDLPTFANYYKRFLIERDELEIAEKDKDNVYIINSNELSSKRLDPNGYCRSFSDLKIKIHASSSPKKKLEDCLLDHYVGNWGKDPDKEFDEEKYEICYVLRNTNFNNNFNLDLSDVALRAIKKSKIKELKLLKGDILVELSGGSPIQPVGRVAIVKELSFDKPVIFGNFVMKLEVDNSVINPGYLFTYLRSLYETGYMRFIQNQTTGIKNLLRKEFLEIEIILLQEEKQVKVAKDYIAKMETTEETISMAYSELRKHNEAARHTIFNISNS